MGRTWLSLGLVVLVGAAVPLACGQKFELLAGAGTGGAPPTSSGDPTSSGGGDTPTTSTMTTTGSGAMPCVTTADCTAPPTVCGEAFCINKSCGWKSTQEDGNTASQVYGDCHDLKCKGGRLLNEVNDTDVYDDSNECTQDLCQNGAPVNMPRAAGETCSADTRLCDGQGACVGCVKTSDCVDPAICRDNYCVPPTCFDKLLSTPPPLGTETDVDCGGSTCAPCGDTKKCLTDTDCVSGVCEKPAGGTSFRCITASCTDLVKNGTETDKDCGGPECVNRCTTGDGCAKPTDCKSGVCMGGKCIAPTCADGVRNGNEGGVDCGANCAPCLGG